MKPDLEDVLIKHPDIQDVAVIGIDDPGQATEVPKAYGRSLKPQGWYFTDLLRSRSFAQLSEETGYRV